MLHFRRPVVFLLFAGLVVHLGVVMTIRARTGAIDGFAFQSLDGAEFHGLARNLASHGEFSDPAESPPKPYTWRTPGYPSFLAIFIALFGDSPAMLIGMQQALSILNLLLLFLVARHHMNDQRAVVAGLFFLIEPFHLYYSLWLLSTTLFVTAVLVIWIVWQRTLSTGKTGWTALLGLLTGMTILIRPAAAFVPVALLIGLVAAKLRVRKPESSTATAPATWLGIAMFAVACFASVGGWMLRNDRVAGHFALSDQGGIVLAYFKSAEVELWRQGRTADRYLETSLNPERQDVPHTVWDDIDRELRDKFPSLTPAQRTGLSWRTLAQGNRVPFAEAAGLPDSFDVSSAMSEIGLSRLAAHPFSTAACYLARCGSTLTFPLNLAIRPPTGGRTNRVVAAGMGWLYLLLCVIALARLIRGRMSLVHAYFPLAVTIALLLTTTPQLDPRFRVPMIPLLVVMAMLPRPSRQADPVDQGQPV